MNAFLLPCSKFEINPSILFATLRGRVIGYGEFRASAADLELRSRGAMFEQVVSGSKTLAKSDYAGQSITRIFEVSI